METKIIRVRLDDKSYKKLKEFSVMNTISQSEIVRVLLKKTNIKIDVRNRRAVILDAFNHGQKNARLVQFYVPEQLFMKLKKMNLENEASYSEIIRQLINIADLSKDIPNK